MWNCVWWLHAEPVSAWRHQQHEVVKYLHAISKLKVTITALQFLPTAGISSRTDFCFISSFNLMFSPVFFHHRKGTRVIKVNGTFTRDFINLVSPWYVVVAELSGWSSGVHQQMHSVGWEDCMSDRFFACLFVCYYPATRPATKPSSGILSPLLEGGCRCWCRRVVKHSPDLRGWIGVVCWCSSATSILRLTSILGETVESAQNLHS